MTLVLMKGEEVGVVRVEHFAPAVMPGFRCGNGVDWIGGPGGSVKRVRLNSCTHRETWYSGSSVSATCLEETEGSGSLWTASCCCQGKAWGIRVMRLVLLCRTGLVVEGAEALLRLQAVHDF